MCIYVHVNVWQRGWICHDIRVKSEDHLTCWFLPSTFLRQDLLFTAGYARLGSLWASGDAPVCLHILLVSTVSSSEISGVCLVQPSMGSEVRGQVLTLALHLIYPVSHLPSHHLFRLVLQVMSQHWAFCFVCATFAFLQEVRQMKRENFRCLFVPSLSDPK